MRIMYFFCMQYFYSAKQLLSSFISLRNKLNYENLALFIMLAYSDNYKHSILIYSQVVLIDTTTNDPMTLKNLEVDRTCKRQNNILKGKGKAFTVLPLHPPDKSSRPGLERKANNLQAQTLRKKKMPVSPEFFTSLRKWQCHLEAKMILFYMRGFLYSQMKAYLMFF